MSNNLKKLAKKMNNLVDCFISRAQIQQDPANDLPREAVRGFLKSKVPEVINKWNEALNDVSDATYNIVKSSTSLDLQITSALNNNQFIVKIIPEIEPNRSSEMEQKLQIYFSSLAGHAGRIATSKITSQNSNWGLYYKKYLTF